MLSKLGFCSRSEATRIIQAGRVTLNERVCRNPDQPTNLDRDRIEVDSMPITAQPKVYVMLNKPLGQLTTTEDELGRPAVSICLPSNRAAESKVGELDQPLFGKRQKPPAKITLPENLSPVGHMDPASEGMLLFTNDTEWADRVTNPANHLERTYRIQINRVADEALCRQLKSGVEVDGATVALKRVEILRGGDSHSWLGITLDEGRNRQIRRVLGACGIDALQLIRVAVGPLKLGPLAKGQWRHLTVREVGELRGDRPEAPGPEGGQPAESASNGGAFNRRPNEKRRPQFPQGRPAPKPKAAPGGNGPRSAA